MKTTHTAVQVAIGKLIYAMRITHQSP